MNSQITQTRSRGCSCGRRGCSCRLAHSEPVSNPRHDTSLFFANRVDELTKGEVKIEVFPAGPWERTIVPATGLTGVLRRLHHHRRLVSTFDPTRIQELIELPYLFDNYSQAYAFMDTPYVTKMYEPLKAKGIHYLATWDNGFRQMTNNTRPITPRQT